MNTLLYNIWPGACAVATCSLVFFEVHSLRAKRHALNIRLAQARYDKLTADRNAKLARWARETMLTVTTRSGYVYATTLADLHTHPDGSERSWSEPAAVSIWSTVHEHHYPDLDPEDFETHD